MREKKGTKIKVREKEKTKRNREEENIFVIFVSR